jgi:hypothetical protein
LVSNVSSAASLAPFVLVSLVDFRVEDDVVVVEDGAGRALDSDGRESRLVLVVADTADTLDGLLTGAFGVADWAGGAIESLEPVVLAGALGAPPMLDGRGPVFVGDALAGGALADGALAREALEAAGFGLGGAG